MVDLEDVPLAVMAQQEHLRNDRGKKTAIGQCRLYQAGRPNPIPRVDGDERGWVVTDELLQKIPWANVFATGPEDPIHNRHKIYCMIRRVNVLMKACGINKIKRRYQSPIICAKISVTEKSTVQVPFT